MCYIVFICTAREKFNNLILPTDNRCSVSAHISTDKCNCFFFFLMIFHHVQTDRFFWKLYRSILGERSRDGVVRKTTHAESLATTMTTAAHGDNNDGDNDSGCFYLVKGTRWRAKNSVSQEGVFLVRVLTAG